MKEIDKLRKEIDNIDFKIVELLEKRAEIAKKIYEVKKKNNIDVFDPQREVDKMIKIESSFQKFPKSSGIRIFREIISGTRSLSREIKISFLGPEGSFSEEAVKKIFGGEIKKFPTQNIKEIFDNVETEKVDYGVVPLENTIDGVIGETLDLLLERNLKIILGTEIEISLCFFAKGKKEEVKKVLSNEKAINQCIGWIRKNIPQAEIKIINSTSLAVKEVSQSEDKTISAIGSKTAGEIFGISPIEENIQDFPSKTFFLVISREVKKGGQRAFICFSLKDEPGSLFNSLKPFAKNKINMKRIISRPDKILKRYNFFVEVEKNEKFQKAIEEMSKKTIFIKILGEYPIL